MNIGFKTFFRSAVGGAPSWLFFCRRIYFLIYQNVKGGDLPRSSSKIFVGLYDKDEFGKTVIEHTNTICRTRANHKEIRPFAIFCRCFWNVKVPQIGMMKSYSNHLSVDGGGEGQQKADLLYQSVLPLISNQSHENSFC